jgi:hypothetical protein
LMRQCLNIGVVTNIHHLSNHTFRPQGRLIRGLPPDLSAGQAMQEVRINLTHGRAYFPFAASFAACSLAALINSGGGLRAS